MWCAKNGGEGVRFVAMTVHTPRQVCIGCAASLLFLVSCPATSFTFSNTNLIQINDSNNPPTPATPYGATNYVGGLSGLVVAKVTLTLYGFSHAYPSDVTMLLTSPGSQRSIVMSEVGGQSQFSVTNLTLTLDDDATNALPFSTPLTSGTFKPTNGYLILGEPSLPYDLPAPAPAGNSNSVTALSIFRNADPNGVWQLFVVDDAAGNAGSISGGWSLQITPAVPLTLTRVQTNAVLAWPGAVTGCTLQWTPSLSLAWSNVTSSPVLVGKAFMVTNAITGSEAFYRLVK